MTKRRQKPIKGCLTLLVLLGSAIGFLWWTVAENRAKKALEARHTEAARQAAIAESQRRVQDATTSLATRHNAIMDWKPSGSRPYTVDFQDAMIRSDGRPVMFTAYPQDIIQTPDAYLVFFSPSLANPVLESSLIDWKTNIYYWLMCDIAQGEQLRDTIRQAKQQNYFVVIAHITLVERPWFAMKIQEASAPELNPRVVLRTAGTAIMAHGRLVDFLPMERDGYPAPPLTPPPQPSWWQRFNPFSSTTTPNAPASTTPLLEQMRRELRQGPQ